MQQPGYTSTASRKGKMSYLDVRSWELALSILRLSPNKPFLPREFYHRCDNMDARNLLTTALKFLASKITESETYNCSTPQLQNQQSVMHVESLDEPTACPINTYTQKHSSGFGVSISQLPQNVPRPNEAPKA